MSLDLFWIVFGVLLALWLLAMALADRISPGASDWLAVSGTVLIALLFAAGGVREWWRARRGR